MTTQTPEATSLASGQESEREAGQFGEAAPVSRSGHTCKEDDCNDGVEARGWCRGHYYRWHKYGTPTPDAPMRDAIAARDIDEIAVERACYGDVEGLLPIDRREAVRRLRLQGMSQPQIARRLQMHERQVVRDLDRFRLLRWQQVAS